MERGMEVFWMKLVITLEHWAMVNFHWNLKITTALEDNKFFSNKSLSNGNVKVSLHIVSLFSNVHNDTCIIAIDKEWEIIVQLTKILFSHWLSFCLIIHISPSIINSLSKLLALRYFGCICDNLLDRVFPTFPFNLLFIKKYVDHIIVALPQHGIDCVVDHFNNHIQYI